MMKRLSAVFNLDLKPLRVQTKKTQYTNIIVFISNEEKRKSTQSKTLTKNHSKL